ncbi:hypothetical protein yc1106_09839 [Curvularia clavata]|uniref:Uncharacterized protein n=1 Tax=Curvularia clavata TaxID=95742 RepID=A0A9Q8ZIY0_CURCL|nr:hypothetical protein yc1106_09839 [Curvularia clavata]
MVTTTPLSDAIFRNEQDIEPGIFNIQHDPSLLKPLGPVANPKDPENFLKRCSGHSKKTSLRCSANIGKKALKGIHLTYLPTCSAHRDQQSLAGWCQFKDSNGEWCGRLFRWTPPHFELCDNHQGHPSTPCYLLKQLPLELRHEIYRYLLPTEPIDSSTAAVHDQSAREANPSSMRGTRTMRSKFPMRLLDLLMVSRQVYAEVKRLLFSIITFRIDVRKDGTFMCGRRLLEPKRADGSSHYFFDQADHSKKKFLKSFDWASAKNYAVDILLENCPIANPHLAPNNVNMTMKSRWDEEVEIYDIRDYISVVVSGILAKATKLNKLQVRLCIADFVWDQDQILSNATLLFGPFERLRNVRQPTLVGVFNGRPDSNSMYPIERGTGRYPIATLNGCMQLAVPAYYELCSVPSLPTNEPALSSGMPEFDTYAAKWSNLISAESSANVTQEPLIRKMFTEFRNFYTELSNQVPDVALKTGRHTFLHRARVAREQEDVMAFRAIRTELLEYWNRYLEGQERRKRTMEARIAKFLQSDTYPSHVWEDTSATQQESSLTTQDPQPPIVLDSEAIARDGIPMTGNQVRPSCHQPPHQQMSQHPPRHNPYLFPPVSMQAAGNFSVSNLRQRQAQAIQQALALQKQAIRQRLQMKQLQQAREYLPVSATIQQQICMLKRKATNEPNAMEVQICYPAQQTDIETAQSSETASISQSGCDNTLLTTVSYEESNINKGDGSLPTSSTSSTNDMTSLLEDEPGPSTKKRRVDFTPGDSESDSDSECYKDGHLRGQYRTAMGCDVHFFARDSDTMDNITAEKGKGKT